MSDYHVLVSLRVLYTVNQSPQYILAKSLDKIAVNTINDGSSLSSAPRHGRTSVKACAMAICRSSPELSPDASKDFSVYILDPLEDLISKSRHGQSGGVAVGMGLMSTILNVQMQESPSVTGTFVGSGGDDDALEVVISLRQVTPSAYANHLTKGVARTSSSADFQARREIPRQFLAPGPATRPSPDERPFASSSKSSSKPSKPKPFNPSHLTRAHLMPTPYIGPPKNTRRTSSNNNQRGDPLSSHQVRAAPHIQVKVESDVDDAISPDPPSSSQETIGSTPDDYSPSLPPSSSSVSIQSVISAATEPSADLSQSAVLLAALSSVGAQQANVNNATGSGVAPNPELVEFFKAYMQFVKAGKDATAASEQVQHRNLPLPATAPDASQRSNPQIEQSLSLTSADKENVKPNPPSFSKKPEQRQAVSTSPLGSSRFNSRLSADGTSLVRSNTMPANYSEPSSSRSSLPLKRKYSESTPSENEAQMKRRLSTSVDQDKPIEARVSNGWGGLRRMADGSIWSGHPPSASSVTVVAKDGQLQKPFVFRSNTARKVATEIETAPARKGPYVVPDWAKNCPPPAPPPRPEDADSTTKDDKKAAKNKKTKSKGLERLGGKGTVKRDRIPSGSKENVSAPPPPTTPPRRVSGPFTPAQNQGVFKTPRSGPRQTPGGLPIFAQSSPAVKSGFVTLFQAFQTSPIRPNSIRSGLSLTPRRTVTSPSEAHGSSLFTPSPAPNSAKSGRNSAGRPMFPAGDPPPSPSPTKQPKQGFSNMLSSRSPSAECENRDETRDPPSCLPIASSDDLTEDSSRTEQSLSSESTVMNLSKIHDWSSLDLPPSSPPPPSSPALAPMPDSDLPPSDAPSDLSETSPSSYADTPTPTPVPTDSGVESQDQTPPSDADVELDDPTVTLGTEYPDSDANALMTDFFSDLGFSDAGATGEEGPAAVAAFNALRNGLYTENFSEAWDLLDNIVLPGAQDGTATNEGFESTQFSDWLTGANGELDFESLQQSFLAGHTQDDNSLQADDKQDIHANLAATNFAELLQGYLV